MFGDLRELVKCVRTFIAIFICAFLVSFGLQYLLIIALRASQDRFMCVFKVSQATPQATGKKSNQMTHLRF